VVREQQEPLRRYFQSVLRGPIEEGMQVQLAHQDCRHRMLELFCRAVPHPQTQLLEIVGIARLGTPSEAALPGIAPLGAAPQEGLARSPEELAFSLAHELNQPLTALAIAARACSQLARAQEVDMQEIIQAIDQLAVQAERAGELARRMRHLAARGAPLCSVVSVQELAKGALRTLGADLERERVSFKLHIAEPIPNIKVDGIQMEQVLVNLIRNAIEAMKDMPMEQRMLTITASRQDRQVVMAVADTGRGLSPAIVERLFQPHQTTKPHGMGLGLAVSRAILQAHAGRLWFEPVNGCGATFCLALPLASRES
jgi:C4-dicarboxylate-specific signal transduction histidine kinase